MKEFQKQIKSSLLFIRLALAVLLCMCAPRPYSVCSGERAIRGGAKESEVWIAV